MVTDLAKSFGDAGIAAIISRRCILRINGAIRISTPQPIYAVDIPVIASGGDASSGLRQRAICGAVSVG
jgi:hypothetical protein